MRPASLSVVVTGECWLGSGFGSVQTAIHEMLAGAEEEVMIAAYRITSSADVLLDELEIVLQRGPKVRFALNRMQNQYPNVVARLTSLSANYGHFELFDFSSREDDDLHAKTIVVDRKAALVGSSNLSRRGLTTNHELAVLLKGDAVQDVASAMNRLFASRYVTSYRGSSFSSTSIEK